MFRLRQILEGSFVLPYKETIKVIGTGLVYTVVSFSQASTGQVAASAAQATPQQPSAASPVVPALPPQGAFGISPEKYNEMVQAIVSMGYPKSEVESALRASYFNPERAVEYLISVKIRGRFCFIRR